LIQEHIPPSTSVESIVNGQCYYFGCHERAGHYLWTEKGSMADRIAKSVLPFRYTILDAGLLPEVGEQVEGEGTIVHFPKWTIISFWDRSVDKRGGCNSAFLIRGHWTFGEAVEIAREKFPWVWSRFTFEVRQAR
jgi:hypothetical protein